MRHVAEAVNVRPSALYRHFSGKPELLTTVIIEEMGPFKQIFTELSGAPLEKVLRRLASAILDGHRLGALWQQEARHLPTEEYAQVRREVRDLVLRLSRLIRAQRPDLGRRDTWMLALFLGSVFSSISYRTAELPHPEYKRVLRAIFRQVLKTTPVKPYPPPEPPPAGFTPSSRRERLLTSALELFAEYGYASVSMEDIGVRAGIVGPSTYHHFESKQHLLLAAFTRGDEWLRYDMHRALARATDHTGALRELMASYVDFATRHSDHVSIMYTKSRYLPEEHSARIKQSQREYISEWLNLMPQVHTSMSLAEAKIRVHAVLTIVNDLARTPGLRDRREAKETAKHVGQALLLPEAES